MVSAVSQTSFLRRVGNLKSTSENQLLVTTSSEAVWGSRLVSSTSKDGEQAESGEQDGAQTTLVTYRKEKDKISNLIMYHGVKDLAQGLAVACILWNSDATLHGKPFPWLEWSLILLGLRTFSNGITFPGWDLDHWGEKIMPASSSTLEEISVEEEEPEAATTLDIPAANIPQRRGLCCPTFENSVGLKT